MALVLQPRVRLPLVVPLVLACSVVQQGPPQLYLLPPVVLLSVQARGPRHLLHLHPFRRYVHKQVHPSLPLLQQPLVFYPQLAQALVLHPHLLNHPLVRPGQSAILHPHWQVVHLPHFSPHQEQPLPTRLLASIWARPMPLTSNTSFTRIIFNNSSSNSSSNNNNNSSSSNSSSSSSTPFSIRSGSHHRQPQPLLLNF